MTDAKTTETLEDLARKIEKHANDSDSQAILAAMVLREARRRVESGETGDPI